MIVGHKRILNYFERVLKRGTLAHAYLFHGPEGVGKKTFAIELAKSLLCLAKTERTFGGCGVCGECRRVETLTHPDLIFLSRESLIVDEENKREIGIKNIHELRRRVGETSWAGGRRVVIIDGAELLSRDAAAALLKTLEEPTEAVVFLLITPSAMSLLDTIRSRAVGLSFSRVGDEEMALLFPEAFPADKTELFALADGRPGVLGRLVSDKNFGLAVKDRFSRLEELVRADIDEKFAFSEKESREAGRLEELIDFLIGRTRAAVIGLSASGDKGGSGELPASLADLVSFLRSLLYHNSILASSAVNRRLLADGVLFDLHILSRNNVI
ncbi:MAG: DNA polymerase III subunit delta' [Candidatus Sungbacteria bacterium]|nr:DNA polymerase III subunit delta' [Candidatus Sungbacteria bacterium]